jgi:hypothetical protein
MNRAGAIGVCNAQREHVLRSLESVGLYKADKTIDRENVSSTIDDFLRSDKLVLPLIGRSGVGKTSTLAQLADSADAKYPPRLLLRGVDVLPAQEGIQDLAESALLQLLSDNHIRAKASVSELSRACFGPSEGLLLIVDGLNEAPMARPELANRWIPSHCTGF